MPPKVLQVDPEAQAGPAGDPGEFEWSRCRYAREALESAHKSPPNLLVLGLDLPDMPGLTLLKVLRDTEYGREMPVIVVAGSKTASSVKEAFELGADDYVVAPVDPRELAARARAVLRRKLQRQDHWAAPLSLAGIDIDPSQRLCVVKGRRVILRPMEFSLLDTFMRRAGRVLTRTYLLETVWGMSTKAETRAVDVMVSRLRKRLGPCGKLIETVSKMGYSFRDPGAK
jgi:two-component system alkaline phosphatase synthesis response regulator PhoP